MNRVFFESLMIPVTGIPVCVHTTVRCVSEYIGTETSAVLHSSLTHPSQNSIDRLGNLDAYHLIYNSGYTLVISLKYLYCNQENEK